MSEQQKTREGEFSTLGGRLARELTAAELHIVAGGECMYLSYPPVTPTMCDPRDP